MDKNQQKEKRTEEYNNYVLPILKILHGKTVEEAKELLVFVNTYVGHAGSTTILSEENTKQLYP